MLNPVKLFASEANKRAKLVPFLCDCSLANLLQDVVHHLIPFHKSLAEYIALYDFSMLQ